MVSIHAPVMDAIATGWDISFSADVSIHAPVMDAIREVIRSNNSKFVSIHAPVMDAICSNSYLFTSLYEFQSTRP